MQVSSGILAELPLRQVSDSILPLSIVDQCAPLGEKDHNEMIDSVTIQNFRGFTHLNLPRLTRFTLIGGGNNAGKSSVLEAMTICQAKTNPGIFVYLQGTRGLTELPLDPNQIWGPFFGKFDLQNPVVITQRSGDRTEKLTMSFDGSYSPKVPTKPGPLGVPTVRADQLGTTVYALKMEAVSGNRTIHNSHFLMSASGLGVEIDLSEPVGKASFLPSRAGSNTRDDALKFGQLDVANVGEAILKFLKIVDDRLRGLSSVAIGNGTVLHGDIGLGKKIPIYHMGDGVVRLLNIMLCIASSPKGIVFIDEFGNGLHYSIFSRVVEAIAVAAKEYDVQIVATTHSYEFLREAHKGLAKNFENDFTYIRLDRAGDKISAKTYEYKPLAAALEQGWEVR
jgi:hypothetical protein